MINIIVAVASNGAIGKDGDLLWHISEDLKYFKKTTLNSTVVMGRKTWEALPFKPLKNRRNIILTKNEDFTEKNAEIFHKIKEIIFLNKENENLFIIGGGAIYKEFLPYADKIYLTKVYKDFDADTFFPTLNADDWKEVFRSERQKDEETQLEFQFFVLERNKRK
jgi:dihydrofolate reductase